MSKKIVYEDHPFGKNVKFGKEVIGLLPPPEELFRKEENIKITLTLTKSSVDFFKKHGKKKHVPYQVMIRNLLEHYSSHFDSK